MLRWEAYGLWTTRIKIKSRACGQAHASGPCGKFGDKLFTATVVRARRKNAGIAGPTSNFFNAAMATVAKKSVIELSARPTSMIRIYALVVLTAVLLLF